MAFGVNFTPVLGPRRFLGIDSSFSEADPVPPLPALPSGVFSRVVVEVDALDLTSSSSPSSPKESFPVNATLRFFLAGLVIDALYRPVVLQRLTH